MLKFVGLCLACTLFLCYTQTNCAAYGEFWNWKDGENGYPVSDGVILITDFKSYLDDSEFHDGDWSADFVNTDRCESLNGEDNDQPSDTDNGTPSTGETTAYVAAIALLLLSAIVALLLVQKKRKTN